MALLEPIPQKTEFPDQGTLYKFSTFTNSNVLVDIARDYANPKEKIALLKDQLSYQASDQITAEKI